MDQNRGKKAGKARIPDHLRRRALVSCDRCKKRRIRCLRSSAGDAQEACQSCLEVGVNCESTLPRKTRIYGSVETLSHRYRVLDALIKGLYPYKDTNNIEILYSIAESHNITLPTFDDQTVAEEVFSQPFKHPEPSPELPGSGERSLSVASKDSDTLTTSSQSKVQEEKLVPLPHGPSHYIGPSSSFGFVLTVRNMVAEFNAALKTIQPDDERTKLSSDFAGSNWSKALEPINKEESDTSSDDHNEREISSSSSRLQNQGLPKPALFSGNVGGNTVASKSRKTPLLSLLPAREVADAFVEAYFDRVHPNYLLFHRDTFQMRYEAMWSHPGVLLRDVEPGWVSVIFMMLVFGAQALEDRDKAQSIQIQRHYLDLVQGRMHQLLNATTLVNVQAILLLQLYQHNCTERNSAFMLLGCASRMAMALGMHREGTSGGFDEMEREVRKRVWWTAYVFEQNQCAILGRPCAIDDSEVNVTFPNELMLDGGISVPPGYMEYSVRLARLMSDVRRKVYATPITALSQPGEYPKISVAVQFLLDLDTWQNTLPAHLRLDFLSHTPTHRRAVILLHIQFHHTQALVTRPFILRKVGVQLARKLGKHVRSQDLDKEEINLSNACGIFSRKSANLLHQLLTTGMFDGVAWLDAYYIYHSVFILALDFLARPWDDKETTEDLTRKQAIRDVMNALQPVKLCPTFTVLTQVSLQLAKIVGIFDTQPPSPEHNFKSNAYHQQIPHHQQPQFQYDFDPHSQPPGVENVVNSWFQKEPVDLPWDVRDFFGVDGYVGHSNQQPPYSTDTTMTVGNAYSHLPGVSEEDDLAPPPPANIGYTHWGAIETPFAQQPRRGPGSGS